MKPCSLGHMDSWAGASTAIHSCQVVSFPKLPLTHSVISVCSSEEMCSTQALPGLTVFSCLLLCYCGWSLSLYRCCVSFPIAFQISLLPLIFWDAQLQRLFFMFFPSCCSVLISNSALGLFSFHFAHLFHTFISFEAQFCFFLIPWGTLSTQTLFQLNYFGP